MSVADLIGRLDRVTQVGNDRWRAICPAHDSKHRTQSLAIRELDDGTLLVRCFAGCEITAIVGAVGMQIRDLFPERHVAPNEPRKAKRANHWHAIREAVKTLHHETLVCAIAAERIGTGKSLSDDDIARVNECASRIRFAIEVCI